MRRNQWPASAGIRSHWLKVLKEDKRAIFSAAAHAQRAVDYLQGLQQAQDKAA
jgi:antirestriction protein ArdC